MSADSQPQISDGCTGLSSKGAIQIHKLYRELLAVTLNVIYNNIIDLISQIRLVVSERQQFEVML